MEDEKENRRIAHAVRGLKLDSRSLHSLYRRRIAHAVRGLKSVLDLEMDTALRSHRSRGAWIEISNGGFCEFYGGVASRKWCVD